MSGKEEWRFHLKNLGRELVELEKELTEGELEELAEQARRRREEWEAQARKAVKTARAQDPEKHYPTVWD
jgi:hypothetical protein